MGSEVHTLAEETRDYWDAFYAQRHPDLERPSTFALACLPLIPPGGRVFEMGCGNGRDALFFAERGFRVTAADISAVAIERLQETARQRGYEHAPVFVEADFARLEPPDGEPFDVVYSRFTLHAVSASDASSAIAWARRAVRAGGRFLIEARSVLGSLYGKGEQVERDAFIHDGHYRRFIRRDELVAELQAVGFDVVQVVESDGLAVYGEDDPVVIRVVARLPGETEGSVDRAASAA